LESVSGANSYPVFEGKFCRGARLKGKRQIMEEKQILDKSEAAWLLTNRDASDSVWTKLCIRQKVASGK